MEKRVKKIEMLENTIKSGMLLQMAQAMNVVNSKSPTAIKQHF